MMRSIYKVAYMIIPSEDKRNYSFKLIGEENVVFTCYLGWNIFKILKKKYIIISIYYKILMCNCKST